MKKPSAKKQRAAKAVNASKTVRAIRVAAAVVLTSKPQQMSDAMRLWVSKNRNIQTTIAGAVPCSPQFVNMVIKGARKHEKVERLLREAGAPIHG